MIKVRRLYPFDDWVFIDMCAVKNIIPVDSNSMKVAYKDGSEVYIDSITYE